jgi:IS605 OrfB family transposase
VHYAAIDLGINNIATVAFTNGDTIIYNGRMILSSDRYYHKRAAKTKPSGWHRGKAMERSSKRNRSYRRKAGDIRRLATHNLTRSIIDEAVKRQVGTIFVGDLKNIRDGKDYGKRMNQRLHAWQFGEIERQLKYKGEAYGIEVVKVSEAYTSQTCSVCGVRRKSNRVHRGLYRCSACGTEQNADVNGARNILRRGIEEKVSPGVQALGVEAVFPGLRSLTVEASRIREVKKDVGDGVTQPSAAGGRGTQQCENANATDYAAKFDLRNLSVTLSAYNVRTVAVGGIC